MKISEYANESMSTATYPNIGKNPFYPVKGLIGETGELAEKLKKIERGDPNTSTDEYIELIKKEIGDVLWYCSAIAFEFDIKLSDDFGDSEPDHITDGNPSLNILKIPIFISEICSVVLIGTQRDLDKYDVETVSFALYEIIDCLNRLSSVFCRTTINEIAKLNIDKLKDRQKRNQLKGSGDNR